MLLNKNTYTVVINSLFVITSTFNLQYQVLKRYIYGRDAQTITPSTVYR